MRHAELGHVAMGIAEDDSANAGHADVDGANTNDIDTLIHVKWISACEGVSGSPWTCLSGECA